MTFFITSVCVCVCLLSLALFGLKKNLRKIEEYWEPICIFCLVNCHITFGLNRSYQSPEQTVESLESSQVLTADVYHHHDM